MSASLVRLRQSGYVGLQAYIFYGYISVLLLLLRQILPAGRSCCCLQVPKITLILHSDNVSQNLCKKSNKKFSVGRYKWRKI